MTEAEPPAARAQNLPATQGEVATAALALGMRIPDACMPGELANLFLLASHADRLFGQGDDRCA